MRQPLTNNRLARARWGEIHRVSHHEKKKKISVRQNPSVSNRSGRSDAFDLGHKMLCATERFIV
jgi:hypothetical protein